MVPVQKDFWVRFEQKNVSGHREGWRATVLATTIGRIRPICPIFLPRQRCSVEAVPRSTRTRYSFNASFAGYVKEQPSCLLPSAPELRNPFPIYLADLSKQCLHCQQINESMFVNLDVRPRREAGRNLMIETGIMKFYGHIPADGGHRTSQLFMQ